MSMVLSNNWAIELEGYLEGVTVKKVINVISNERERAIDIAIKIACLETPLVYDIVSVNGMHPHSV